MLTEAIRTVTMLHALPLPYGHATLTTAMLRLLRPGGRLRLCRATRPLQRPREPHPAASDLDRQARRLSMYVCMHAYMYTYSATALTAVLTTDFDRRARR